MLCNISIVAGRAEAIVFVAKPQYDEVKNVPLKRFLAPRPLWERGLGRGGNAFLHINLLDIYHAMKMTDVTS